MIIGIFGLEGSGKTLLSVMYGTYFHFKRYRIIANVKSFKYADFNFEKDFMFLLNDIADKRKNGQKIPRTIAIVDEVTQYLDARESMKPLNRKLSRKLLQIRKYGIDLIYTTQLYDLNDKRLRKTTEIFVQPEYHEFDRTLHWEARNREGKTLVSKTIIVPSVFFKLYDTFEEIKGEVFM